MKPDFVDQEGYKDVLLENSAGEKVIVGKLNPRGQLWIFNPYSIVAPGLSCQGGNEKTLDEISKDIDDVLDPFYQCPDNVGWRVKS